MFKSVLQVILACFLWGALFAVPLYLEEYYPIDIVLGRYFFYGIVSIIIFLVINLQKKQANIFKYAKEAAICAFIMNILHYSALTLGIRFSNPTLMTLILGVSPITITAVSCWTRRELHLLKVLFWPSVCIFCGIILMNLELMSSTFEALSFWGYINGVFYGMTALGTWTWYVVYNSNFLRKNQDITANQWTILLGIMTFIFASLAIGIRYFYLGNTHFYQFHWEHQDGRFFLFSMFFLGVFCSWIAFALWNASSSKISPALGGQLSILETVFGLSFVYSIQGKLPTTYELLGIFLILLGVSSGLYFYMRKREPHYAD